MGDHPLLAGFIGGAGAVAIAVARAFEGVRTAPADAAIISLVVVAVWMVLFYFLRNFFSRQAIRQTQVRRDLEVTNGVFCWLEDDEVLKRVDAPEFRLYSTSIPEEMRGERKVDQPWPVWLVVSGEGDRFVLKTKITVGEAKAYEEVDVGVAEATDEVLPTGLASSLLSCADRATSKDN